MKPLLRQEGLSPIVGAVLVIGIFTGLIVTVYSSYSRAASRNEEAETLTSLLQTFLEAKEKMEAMENGATFALSFKSNVGGKTGGSLWVRIPSTWGEWAGRMGFTSRGLEIGDLSLVLEGGGLIRITQEGAEMLSPPVLLKVSEVKEENMIRWLRIEIRRMVVEGRNFQVVANTPVSLRFTCTSDLYTVVPENGRPNREKVVLSLENWVSSESREAWRKYLEFLSSFLPPYYGVSLHPTLLVLTVEGFQSNPGVKDILYYERYTKIKVEVA